MGIAYVTEAFNKDILASVLSVESLVKTLITSGVVLLLGWLADTYTVGVALAVVSGLLLVLSPFYLAKEKSKITSQDAK